MGAAAAGGSPTSATCRSGCCSDRADEVVTVSATVAAEIARAPAHPQARHRRAERRRRRAAPRTAAPGPRRAVARLHGRVHRLQGRARRSCGPRRCCPAGRCTSPAASPRRERARPRAGRGGRGRRRLVFHDGVDDAAYARLLDEATALVSASRDEGFGIPVVEAMQRGVPVVLTDIPIFREVGGDAALYARVGTRRRSPPPCARLEDAGGVAAPLRRRARAGGDATAGTPPPRACCPCWSAVGRAPLTPRRPSAPRASRVAASRGGQSVVRTGSSAGGGPPTRGGPRSDERDPAVLHAEDVVGAVLDPHAALGPGPAGDVADQRADHAAVADDEQPAVRVLLGERDQGRPHPLDDRLARLPRLQHAGPARVDLLAGHPLGLAVVALHEGVHELAARRARPRRR